MPSDRPFHAVDTLPATDMATFLADDTMVRNVPPLRIICKFKFAEGAPNYACIDVNVSDGNLFFNLKHSTALLNETWTLPATHKNIERVFDGD